MKLAVLSRSLPFHQIGGMEMIIWGLINEFKKLDIDIDVITTDIPGKNEIIYENGIKIINLKETVPGKYSLNWWKKSKEYVKNNYDKNTLILGAGYSANSILGLGYKVIYQAHGTPKGEFISKIRNKTFIDILKSVKSAYWFIRDFWILPKYSYIITIGDNVFNDFKKFPLNFLVNKKKVSLIRNGVNTELFKFSQKNREKIRKKYNIKDEKVFISVSRLHKQKGVDVSLKMFYEYYKKDNSAKFFIIGDGEEKENLKNLAKKFKIENNIYFLGALKREEISEFLSASDIFLFFTLRKEGLPLNILEALSSGLNVIASHNLDLGIDLNKRINLINPFNKDNFLQIVKSFKNSERKNLLPNEYSLNYCAKEYIKIFERLINV